MRGGSLLLFFALVLFFPLPSDQIGGGFLVCYFFLSFSSFVCVFGCSDGMEREACVCDHGFERSDLCAVIIIIIIIIIIILGIKFVGRTSRSHTGGKSHRISHPPSFCGACLNFSFFSREEFNHSFPSSTVKWNFVY